LDMMVRLLYLENAGLQPQLGEGFRSTLSKLSLVYVS